MLNMMCSGPVPVQKSEKKNAYVGGNKRFSLWHVIQHCFAYILVAFFVGIVIYYFAARSVAKPALTASSGK